MPRVHIEFQRVQTWLFSVPRLRAMVGANTLLGEVLRNRLPDLAREQSSWQLAPIPGEYPSAIADDPLSDHDDPASDARDGILSRDGGHFEATFETGAQNFVKAAAALLRKELPGIRFRISVDGVTQDEAGVGLSMELPVLAPCQWTGRGLASCFIKQGKDSVPVSLEVSRRHEAAKRAANGDARDLASLLVATTSLKRLEEKTPVQTFEELVGDNYLALVHADGNGVGGAAGTGDAERGVFFHRNRVLLRQALRTAVEAVCDGAGAPPLQPLMLGGDDLLVVSRAAVALRFVTTLCEALDGRQSDDQPGFKLTLGVGVVFARPTIPIHRLHDVAERLAASAKRRFRGFSKAEHRSVVDWAVYTTTWVDDPEEMRRRDWVRGTGDTIRVLSRRPLDVLGKGLDSLQGLVAAAEKITAKDAPRSQFRYLVEQLPKGRTLADLALAEMSPMARKALATAGIENVWEGPDRGLLLTSVLDLLEVSEIGRLGRTGKPGHPDVAETSGKVAHVEA